MCKRFLTFIQNRWTLLVSNIVAVLFMVVTVVLTFIGNTTNKHNLDKLISDADGRINLSRLQNVTYTTEFLFQAAIVDPNYIRYFNQSLQNVTYYEGIMGQYANMTMFDRNLQNATRYWYTALNQCANQSCNITEVAHIYNYGLMYLVPVRDELQALFGYFNGLISNSSLIAFEAFSTYVDVIASLLLVVAAMVLVVTGVVVYYQIAEYRKRESLLEQQVLVANAEVQSRTNFLSVVNHEARTSLNSVVSMAELLGLTILDNYQRELLTTLQLGTASLMFQINDLLLYLKVQSGKFTIQPEWVDARRYLEEICRPFAQRAALKNIVFQHRICRQLPRNLLIDGDRYKQIIINLLENSIKFTQRGYIKCLFSFDENVLQAKIEDTGIGMTEDECERIWQPFMQANASITATYGGSGLGCSIVKELAEHMGGGVRVTSVKDEGSVFTVKIHALADNERVIIPAVPAVIDTAALIDMPQNILIVDDNIANRKVASRVLATLNCRSTGMATNGLEAITYWEEHPNLQVILMDMQMPHMDGVEATKKIRMLERLYNRNTVNIIGVTGNVSGDDTARCREAGMNSVVAKPISRVNIFNAIMHPSPSQYEYVVVVPPGATPPFSARVSTY